MAAPIKKNRSRLVFDKSSFLDQRSRHRKTVENHHYNSNVDIIIPHTENGIEGWNLDLGNVPSYLIKDVPVSFIVSEEFIGVFIKAGKVSMLSVNTSIDCHDCIAITSEGELILHVLKSTYHTLGLDGQSSQYYPQKDKYVVRIDLKGENMSPCNKFYQRLKRCVTSNFTKKFDFLISWTPDDDSIWGGSIGSYFTNNGFKAKEQKLKKFERKLEDQMIPKLDSEQLEDSPEKELCGHEEMYEWLGAVSCGLNVCEKSADDFLSTFCPATAVENSRYHFTRISGFITSTSIHAALAKIRDHIKASKIPWAALTVHGYADSPVSWAAFEHGFETSGDNSYTFVTFANDTYWLYKGLSAYDVIS